MKKLAVISALTLAVMCLTMLAQIAMPYGVVDTAWAASARPAARYPEDPGRLKQDGKLKVDVNHTSDGYFLASLTGKSKKKMKLRVALGKETLTYDLNGNATFEVFPFQLGNGKYTISLYENVSGKKYTSAGTITVNVKLSSPDVCFLYPNQYVMYTAKSDAVKQATKLCDDMKKDGDVYKKICSYMSTSFVYDFIKAATIKAGQLPDLEGCFKTKRGVCQDLSAVMVCMLRSQGVPAKLMIGYADNGYHAWVIAIYNGKEYFFDPTAALSAISKVETYTAERCY
ncbi:MAG: transglutaminase domain-containing protein [Clostridia bacterium]|nr:transglutaminase domain-containing protein [Clostridia bacterium]